MQGCLTWHSRPAIPASLPAHQTTTRPRSGCRARKEGISCRSPPSTATLTPCFGSAGLLMAACSPQVCPWNAPICPCLILFSPESRNILLSLHALPIHEDQEQEHFTLGITKPLFEEPISKSASVGRCSAFLVEECITIWCRLCGHNSSPLEL